MKLALQVVLMPEEAILRYTRLRSALKRTGQLHEILAGEPTSYEYDDGRTACVYENGTRFLIDDRPPVTIISASRDGIQTLYSEQGKLLACFPAGGGGAPLELFDRKRPPADPDSN
jgi:hypothetical protein